jgi:hypothetical protein
MPISPIMPSPRHRVPRSHRRFARQIARLQRAVPVLGRTLSPGSRLRLPIAVVLILGGLVGFLPVVGFWMLPLGLLLLAIDMPFLRPAAASATVRLRHWSRVWSRRLWRR